jgi:hypothetical protein
MISFELIISVIALCISLLAIILTRVHNRLSVRPFLNIVNTVDKENGIFTSEVTNNGLGPAVIEKPVSIMYNNKKYEEIKDVFYDVNQGGWLNDIDWNKNLHLNFDKDIKLTIPVNGKISIYNIHLKNKDSYNAVRNILFKLELNLEYKDVYNKKYESD